METIFALSSGQLPAAIAVVRVSGPQALGAAQRLCGPLPPPRQAQVRTLRDAGGGILDRALVIVFPGPESATGEDLAELHLHGGKAVVAAVSRALETVEGVRPAAAGEFTRRAFANGRMDLAEAEGLAELLAAESELGRRVAIDIASGGLSRRIESWRDRILLKAALVEALLDFGDEDDVAGLPVDFADELDSLAGEFGKVLAAPPVERLHEGFRVALTGPPNAGKSSLFNALLEENAAIATPVPGTTRDVLERSVAIDGIPFTLVDMAGLRDDAGDAIETLGIERARREIERADLVLWLGAPGDAPEGAEPILAKADLRHDSTEDPSLPHVSSLTGEGVEALRQMLVVRAQAHLPKPGAAALNRRQRALMSQAIGSIEAAARLSGLQQDPLLVAEELRRARLCFDAMVGRSGVEDVLDALFGRFCIGK